MRVLSWDVGIRNAAYCLRERYVDTKTNKLRKRTLSWGLVDLLDRFERRCKCGRTAMWITASGGNLSWCGQHVGGNGVIPCKTPGAKCIDCGKKAYVMVKGRSKQLHCVAHTELPKLKRYQKVSCKKFAIDKLKDVLISELEKRPEFLLVDHVVIENQPSLTNPKMKAISETMYHWFLIRGKVDRQLHMEAIARAAEISRGSKRSVDPPDHYRHPSCIKTVRFMNPNAKIPDRKITREDRKAKIMAICASDIRKTKWEKYYLKHPKKDDLADCHVQADVLLEQLKDIEEWQLDDEGMAKWMKKWMGKSRKKNRSSNQ